MSMMSDRRAGLMLGACYQSSAAPHLCAPLAGKFGPTSLEAHAVFERCASISSNGRIDRATHEAWQRVINPPKQGGEDGHHHHAASDLAIDA